MNLANYVPDVAAPQITIVNGEANSSPIFRKRAVHPLSPAVLRPRTRRWVAQTIRTSSRELTRPRHPMNDDKKDTVITQPRITVLNLDEEMSPLVFRRFAGGEILDSNGGVYGSIHPHPII